MVYVLKLMNLCFQGFCFRSIYRTMKMSIFFFTFSIAEPFFLSKVTKFIWDLSFTTQFWKILTYILQQIMIGARSITLCFHNPVVEGVRMCHNTSFEI